MAFLFDLSDASYYTPPASLVIPFQEIHFSKILYKKLYLNIIDKNMEILAEYMDNHRRIART
jgi:hypothetical protein